MIDDQANYSDGEDVPFLLKFLFFILLLPVTIFCLPAFSMSKKYSHRINNFLGSCQLIIFIISFIIGIAFKDSKIDIHKSNFSTFEIITFIFFDIYLILAVIKTVTIIWSSHKKN